MGLFDRFRRKKKPEVSPGGSTIYRYEEQEREFQVPEQMGVYMEEIETHFQKLFPGGEGFVYHEILSDLVHIDVHVIGPTEERPFYFLFTTGMSDLPMTLPEELKNREDLKHAELYLFLPKDWALNGPGGADRDMPYRYSWPIQALKFLARFPHEYQTWLAYGHTIPNGADYTPFDESVGFGGVVLAWSAGPLGGLKARDGMEIHFYEMVPAYKEEIEFKLEYGMEALIQKFNDAEMGHVLDIRRPNTCADFTEVLD